MSSPLSNEQKGRLCQLARQAYDAWTGREAFEEANPTLAVSKCFEAWRRVEQGKAVREQSLTRCTQDHFLPLRAHFKAMLGNGDGALRDHLRAQEEPRIRARWKLEAALAERGLDQGYAAAICRRQFKCELGDASEKQLWALFFTVTNRRKPVAGGASKVKRPRYVGSHLGTLSVSHGNTF
ncbi:hypothetical protein [Horticoccus sp. 23ND18S-11]|uniref:hypothetical protein n=1 Tax=Horticoccus sp. 23ND18S-11 TaxID=3391832 RepID=UPI0039C8F43A